MSGTVNLIRAVDDIPTVGAPAGVVRRDRDGMAASLARRVGKKAIRISVSRLMRHPPAILIVLVSFAASAISLLLLLQRM